MHVFFFLYKHKMHKEFLLFICLTSLYSYFFIIFVFIFEGGEGGYITFWDREKNANKNLPFCFCFWNFWKKELSPNPPPFPKTIHAFIAFTSASTNLYALAYQSPLFVLFNSYKPTLLVSYISTTNWLI